MWCSSSASDGINSLQCWMVLVLTYRGRFGSGWNLINSQRWAQESAFVSVLRSKSTVLFPVEPFFTLAFRHSKYLSQVAGVASSTGIFSHH